jgi:two-component system sensor histidine kinase PhoQ
VLASQLRTFRGALWGYLGSAGAILLLLQVGILNWSLRPLQRVISELTRVQRGQASRMSERHPRELEPLTESINAFIESERENLDRQRNTLADLAHSLKTPLAVLRAPGRYVSLECGHTGGGHGHPDRLHLTLGGHRAFGDAVAARIAALR